MTWNVNFGLPPESGISIIEQSGADIVCLQESTALWEQSLRDRLALKYPYMLFQNEPAAGGMAILSRLPIEEIYYDQPRGGWFHGWAVRTQTDVGELQLLNVHLHPPLSESGGFTGSAYFRTQSTRRGEIEHLYQQLPADTPTIILGDFNENDPGDALRYLRERGFTDSLAQFDRSTNTWRWETSIVDLTGRYDHILHSAQLHCWDARVLEQGVSDHLPVIAVLGPGKSQ